MRQLLAGIIFCGLISFAGDCYAQHNWIDNITAKYVGKNINDYVSTFNQFKEDSGSRITANRKESRSIRDGNFVYQYNEALVVYSATIFCNPDDSTRIDEKNSYGRFVSPCSTVVNSMFAPGDREEKENGRIAYTWKGDHSIITAVRDKDDRYISISFVDTNIPEDNPTK